MRRRSCVKIASVVRETNDGTTGGFRGSFCLAPTCSNPELRIGNGADNVNTPLRGAEPSAHKNLWQGKSFVHGEEGKEEVTTSVAVTPEREEFRRRNSEQMEIRHLSTKSVQNRIAIQFDTERKGTGKNSLGNFALPLRNVGCSLHNCGNQLLKQPRDRGLAFRPLRAKIRSSKLTRSTPYPACHPHVVWLA